MTYGILKAVTKGLLTGDNKMPAEEEVIVGLLGMAYDYIANKCQVMNLMTLDDSEEILRIGSGDYLVRKPDLPTGEDDDEVLDIDDSLGYVAASLVASLISKNKIRVHEERADRGIILYNAKVTEFLETYRLNEKTKEYEISSKGY